MPWWCGGYIMGGYGGYIMGGNWGYWLPPSPEDVLLLICRLNEGTSGIWSSSGSSLAVPGMLLLLLAGGLAGAIAVFRLFPGEEGDALGMRSGVMILLGGDDEGGVDDDEALPFVARCCKKGESESSVRVVPGSSRFLLVVGVFVFVFVFVRVFVPPPASRRGPASRGGPASREDPGGSARDAEGPEGMAMVRSVLFFVGGVWRVKFMRFA
jgi:hypothetical protein